MRRLFVAVDIDESTRAAIDELSRTLRADARLHAVGRTTWVSKNRMHLTLHFEGEADAEIERRLLDALATPIPVSPFDMSFRGLGVFPERGAPRVLWLGIGEGLDSLRAVQAELQRRINGRQRRVEPFHPHLTLARLRDRISRTTLTEITAFPAAAGPSPIDRVTLYESRLSPRGPTYTAIGEALLKAPS